MEKFVPSFREFVVHSLDSVLNLDSKIFVTLKALFVPAKLTRDYFQGIRQPYYSPFRIFFVSSLFFLAVVNFMSGGEGMVKSDGPALLKEVNRNVMLWNALDSLGRAVGAKRGEDSLAMQKVIDALKVKVPDFREDSMDIYVKVSQRDLVSFAPAELAERYGVEGFWERLFFIQMVKLVKSPQSYNRYLKNNMMWLLVLSMPILAFVLRLQYRKFGRYYMEYLVFLLHYTAFVFFGSAVVFFLESALGLSGFFVVLLIFQFLFLLFAMKAYYGQPWGRTTFKWVMFNFYGSFVFALVFAFFALVSFLFFS